MNKIAARARFAQNFHLYMYACAVFAVLHTNKSTNTDTVVHTHENEKPVFWAVVIVISQHHFIVAISYLLVCVCRKKGLTVFRRIDRSALVPT